MAPENAVGYVIMAAEEHYLFVSYQPEPCYYWRHVPSEQADVHPKDAIKTIDDGFKTLEGTASMMPQSVFEAYRQGGKTKLFSGISFPFDEVVKSLKMIPAA